MVDWSIGRVLHVPAHSCGSWNHFWLLMDKGPPKPSPWLIPGNSLTPGSDGGISGVLLEP